MPTPVHAAARRLSGHLVATPVVGDLRLPGCPVAPGLRVKVECLQPAGTAWYRGYLHYLLVSLGRYKGLVLHGPPERILAQALAGAVHRLPMVAVAADLPPAVAEVLAASGGEVVVDGSPEGPVEQSRARGFTLAAGAEEPAVRAGLATLGLELAAELPADVRRVVLPAGSSAEAVRDGFAAAGRVCAVVVAPGGTPPAGWRDAVAAGLHLAPADAGLCALSREAAAPDPVCVVL